VKEKTSEICESCHNLLLQVFDHKMKMLIGLAEECSRIYKLPSKDIKATKRVGKNKKSE